MVKISIIVPVYKVEKYLDRCINSILNQTYKNFELILVNDGSPDNCGILCDKFALKDNRIKVIHKKNGGLSSARNAGLDIAIGQYVGFVDSDDWITSDMYEYLLDLIEKYDCDISSVSYMLTKGNEAFRQAPININCYEGVDSLRNYLYEGMSKRVADYPVWNKLYNRQLFNNIRFPIGQLYEDGATNFLLLEKAKKYVKSNKVSYYYYQDGAGITRRGFKQQDLEILEVSNQMLELALKYKDDEINKLTEMKLARSYFSLLSKISFFGIGEEIENKKELVDRLNSQLRKKYFLLLKSPMPINRKIIMTLICININLVKMPVSIYRALKR
ncbi:glycosyltransferase family 2 protein [Paenibacillus camerounensis]|uniref:glycosyltransferase family 2 protein n=1 Tax=Paenibacillus camerounensis TaxID=1243663 RepID=UPI0005AACCA4|nr:glycosyltransferase [Paenibacillus camerounensis]